MDQAYGVLQPPKGGLNPPALCVKLFQRTGRKPLQLQIGDEGRRTAVRQSDTHNSGGKRVETGSPPLQRVKRNVVRKTVIMLRNRDAPPLQFPGRQPAQGDMYRQVKFLAVWQHRPVSTGPIFVPKWKYYSKISAK